MLETDSKPVGNNHLEIVPITNHQPLTTLSASLSTSMASIIEIFPREVISAIIGTVGSYDTLDQQHSGNVGYKTLKACSLTCHALLPHCREHIFRSIHIHDSSNPTGPSVTSRFVQLIANTPEIADYVRELSYGMRLYGEIHRASVTSALDRLTRVQSLSLHIQGYATYWSQVPSSTRSSFLRLIRLPTIISLKFRFIDDFDLSDLVLCKNLQKLHFYNVTFKDNGELDPLNLPAESIRLQELRLDYPTIEDSPKLILEQKRPDGKPIFDLSDLRSVALLISRTEDLSWAQEVLARTSRLESVELTGVNPSLTEAAASLVSKSESLPATLKVLFFNVYIKEHPSDPLCGICEVLKEIAGKNQIEVIKIRIFMYNGNCPLGDEWGDLERAVLAPGWPSLHQVDLHIMCYNGVRLVEDLKHLPEVQFPLLSTTQSFKFDFRVSRP